MSDAIPLPPRPRLDQYKKRAKDLQHARRSGGVPCKLTEAQFVIAREHGFASWPKFAKHIEALARSNSPVSLFESAVDAIIGGDSAKVASLLREHSNLVQERSTRAHRSTLLHYVSANGVEDFRQKTPPNITDIANTLLDAGADVNAESDAYGGRSTALGLVATSVHPEKAGVQIDLLKTLLHRGARILPGSVRSCLHNGQPRAADFLAAHGAPVNLEEAAGLGRVDLVEAYLACGEPVERNAACLKLAMYYRHPAVVRLLLQHGWSEL